MPLLQPATSTHARHIKSLTSLRFAAAFWVLILHYTDALPYDFLTHTMAFAQGGLGVDFFFILSGFILQHVYLAEFNDGRFRYGYFLQRRLARIYPLHLVSFLLVVGYVVAGHVLGIRFKAPEAYALSEIPPNLLLLHAWGLGRMSWNYVSWSISAEWFAYLIFPALTLAFLRMRLDLRLTIVLALLLLGAFYLAAEPLIGGKLTDLTSFAIFRIFPEFTLGIALYHLSLRYDLATRWAVPVSLAAVIALLIVTHMGASKFIALCLLGLLIFASASLERLGRAGVLRSPYLVYLGEISYALYMLHAIIFIVYFKGLDLLLGESFHAWVFWLGPLALVSSLAAASLAYHLVEVPCRRFLSRPDLLAAAGRWFWTRTSPDPAAPDPNAK